MVAGSLNQLASAAAILKVVIPACLSGVVLYKLYQGFSGSGRTMNEEWYTAGEAMMEAMPRQGSDTPIRINPFSNHNNMHYPKSLF